MGCGDKLNLSVKGQTQFAPTYILIFTDSCTNSEFGRQAIDLTNQRMLGFLASIQPTGDAIALEPVKRVPFSLALTFRG
jgi:hypothetical protein